MTFLVRKFLTSVGRSRSVVQRSFASKCQSASELEVTLDEESGIQTIRLNRPNRLNAINGKLYAAIPAVLTEAAEDPKVKLTVLTGTGRFYSSGNDLADFTQKWMDAKTPKDAAEMSGTILRNFVANFIEYPKMLVAAVNGPAVGIAATSLALFDAVYMSDQATLRTPFASTAQAPEGCASYTFPRLMGPLKANELLLFDKTMSAEEAEKCGLCNEVFPHEVFEAKVQERLEELSSFHPLVLERIKSIMRRHDVDVLHAVNEAESQHLIKVWQSPECEQALQILMAKLKSK